MLYVYGGETKPVKHGVCMADYPSREAEEGEDIM